MTSLTAIFGSATNRPDENEPESERLLNLYWNRAELKKEFAELRSEKFRLQERLNEQAGTTARIEQKLQHLENLLLDPDWVYNIVTFFQLRRLNMKCKSKLAKFAEQLKRQREQKVHKGLLDNWNGERALEMSEIDRKIAEHRMQVQLLEDRLQSERHRLATMGAIAKLFRGRSATVALDNLASSLVSSQEDERLLLLQLDAVEKREPPDTQGLDISTKRRINFMILAFGQELYLHFREDSVAEMAKESGEKSIGAINYGGKLECDEILANAKRLLDSFDKSAGLTEILQRRAKLIAERARFNSDDDAVPIAASVATVYAIHTNGLVKEIDENLLGENYWELNSVVSR